MRKSILIADDDSSYLSIIQEVLESQFDVIIMKANSGHEARAILETHNVHLIISDLQMPKGDGYYLLQERNRINELIPFILVTGSGISKEELKVPGASAVVDKLKIVDSLSGLIERYLL